MELDDNISQFFRFQMSIHLSRSNAAVTQHFLDESQICTILQQMCRKRMAESVRRNTLVDTGFLSQFLYDDEDNYSGHIGSSRVKEKDILEFFIDFTN